MLLVYSFFFLRLSLKSNITTKRDIPLAITKKNGPAGIAPWPISAGFATTHDALTSDPVQEGNVSRRVVTWSIPPPLLPLFVPPWGRGPEATKSTVHGDAPEAVHVFPEPAEVGPVYDTLTPLSRMDETVSPAELGTYRMKLSLPAEVKLRVLADRDGTGLNVELDHT
jgi:hypothetical protein